MMRILLLMFTLMFSSIAHTEEITNRIISVQNTYFMFFSGNEYKEIFRTPNGSSIYGYGLLSNDKALFAYQDPEAAEALAIIHVIDTNTGATLFKDEFGGAGETSFDFSNKSGKGVFNDFHGLSIIQLGENDLVIHPVPGVTDENPMAPFWVNSDTIGYFIYKDDGQIFKTVKAP